MEEDEKLVLLLGDIGVFGFRKVFEKFSDRAFNIGILEQSMVSLSSGLSIEGLIPVVHTIAPFMVERAYEQIKNDFCYQLQGGNFVSVGAPYDYAALGCTHHCPGDVTILNALPNMQILVPGTANEFDILFRQAYNNSFPTYYRLSSNQNKEDNNVKFGKGELIKTGSRATVIAFGPTLDLVLEATHDIDVTVLYYTTVKPFDRHLIKEHYNKKIYVVEPFYTGTTYKNILESCKGKSLTIDGTGIPDKFLHSYGTRNEHDQALGFTVDNIKNKINTFL
jgi:transketolase